MLFHRDPASASDSVASLFGTGKSKKIKINYNGAEKDKVNDENLMLRILQEEDSDGVFGYGLVWVPRSFQGREYKWIILFLYSIHTDGNEISATFTPKRKKHGVALLVEVGSLKQKDVKITVKRVRDGLEKGTHYYIGALNGSQWTIRRAAVG